ncbi:MAG: AraC family transcriptional regulator [Chitinophagaceae bacterium]
MFMKIVARSSGELKLSDVVPPALAASRIPGAGFVVATGIAGDLLFQEFQGLDFYIVYMCATLKRAETFTYTGKESQPVLHINLVNSRLYDSGNKGERLMHEWAYNLMYTPGTQINMRFRKPGYYENISVYYTGAYLERFIKYYPVLSEFIEKMDQQQATALWRANQVAPTEMLDAVDSILHPVLNEELLPLYLKAKGQEILAVALQQATLKPVVRAVRFSDREIENIYRTRDWLLKNLDQYFSLQQIAATAGVTVYKLQAGFKKIYGMPVFEFVRWHRMVKAKKLLVNTSLSMTEIAARMGYRNTVTFSAAFKACFHTTPGSLRKK